MNKKGAQVSNGAAAQHPASGSASGGIPAHASYRADERGYDEIDADDLDLLADSRYKPTRLTIVLVVLIGVALAFGAGVLVQKNYGRGTSTASGLPAGLSARLPGAATGRTGGYGTGAGFPGGAPPGGTAQGQASVGTGQSGSSASFVPVVVGTIAKISGNVLTVKNFAGKSVAVTVPKGASLTLPAGSQLTLNLAVGATVSVAGTTNSDGSVKASAVMVRSTTH